MMCHDAEDGLTSSRDIAFISFHHAIAGRSTMRGYEQERWEEGREGRKGRKEGRRKEGGRRKIRTLN
jgi:hypothetical protein